MKKVVLYHSRHSQLGYHEILTHIEKNVPEAMKFFLTEESIKSFNEGENIYHLDNFKLRHVPEVIKAAESLEKEFGDKSPFDIRLVSETASSYTVVDYDGHESIRTNEVMISF